MSATALGVAEYRALLSAALPAAQDADTVQPSLTSLFTQGSHRLAVDVDATVVRGGRGVGKTFWYRSLLDEELRRVAADEYRVRRLRDADVRSGFGAALEPDSYPGPGELRGLVDAGVDPYELWTAVLLVALGHPDLLRARYWTDRVDWVRHNPGQRDRWISETERTARQSGTMKLILFDALEHLHSERGQADRLAAGILRLALELRLGTRSIRAKIFIRPDMFDSASQHFSDASKLASDAANLTWSTIHLYGLLFHHLGNHPSPEAMAFRALIPGWTEPTPGRFLPPPALGQPDEQTRLFEAMAGPYMGANFRKGATYTWLPNHLMDAVEQVSPRSFLNALTRAVEETRADHADHKFAIHHEGIRRGVRSASRFRVDEIREDLPWVQTAINPLKGQQVPIERGSVVELWKTSDLTTDLRRQAEETGRLSSGDTRTGPRFPDDYPRLIEELAQLGVMRLRKDGRVDLPDVYRVAFAIGRKGGVPKVRA
jgi:hypothetical protein